MRNKIVIAIAAGCTATLIGAAPAFAAPGSTPDSFATVHSSLRMLPVVEAPAGSETASQRNARTMAGEYLDYTAFSRSGLIQQLEYEGFSTADATYGADSVNADWDEQAVKKAQDYLDFTAFSRSGLIDQLMYEGFTAAQAEYGVRGAGM